MRRSVLVLLAGALAWGCDSGPSGPGEYQGTVQTPGPPLGGAVLEVAGKGIEGFSASGATRVFSAPRSGVPNAHRVVIVTSAPGNLAFRVSVRDLGSGAPTAQLVSLTSADNIPIPATPDYKVGFSRSR